LSKHRDLLHILGVNSDNDIARGLEDKQVKTWDDFFKLQKEKQDQLTSFRKPIYKNQNEKIVDILHFILSSKRVYKHTNAINNVKVYIPTFILASNSEMFRNMFLDQSMLVNYGAIARNRLIVVILTEREIFKIYGNSGLSAMSDRFFDEESYEKKLLSTIVHKKITEQETALKIDINGLNINPDYLTKYDNNSSLMELIESGEFVLENTFIDKKNLIIDFVSQ